MGLAEERTGLAGCPHMKRSSGCSSLLQPAMLAPTGRPHAADRSGNRETGGCHAGCVIRDQSPRLENRFTMTFPGQAAALGPGSPSGRRAGKARRPQRVRAKDSGLIGSRTQQLDGGLISVRSSDRKQDGRPARISPLVCFFPPSSTVIHHGAVDQVTDVSSSQ